MYASVCHRNDYSFTAFSKSGKCKDEFDVNFAHTVTMSGYIYYMPKTIILNDHSKNSTMHMIYRSVFIILLHTSQGTKHILSIFKIKYINNRNTSQLIIKTVNQK